MSNNRMFVVIKVNGDICLYENWHGQTQPDNGQVWMPEKATGLEVLKVHLQMEKAYFDKIDEENGNDFDGDVVAGEPLTAHEMWAGTKVVADCGHSCLQGEICFIADTTKVDGGYIHNTTKTLCSTCGQAEAIYGEIVFSVRS